MPGDQFTAPWPHKAAAPCRTQPGGCAGHSVLLGVDAGAPKRTGQVVKAIVSFSLQWFFFFFFFPPPLLVVVTSWYMWREFNRFVSYSTQLKSNRHQMNLSTRAPAVTGCSPSVPPPHCSSPCRTKIFYYVSPPRASMCQNYAKVLGRLTCKALKIAL